MNNSQTLYGLLLVTKVYLWEEYEYWHNVIPETFKFKTKDDGVELDKNFLLIYGSNVDCYRWIPQTSKMIFAFNTVPIDDVE